MISIDWKNELPLEFRAPTYKQPKVLEERYYGFVDGECIAIIRTEPRVGGGLYRLTMKNDTISRIGTLDTLRNYALLEVIRQSDMMNNFTWRFDQDTRHTLLYQEQAMAFIVWNDNDKAWHLRWLNGVDATIIMSNLDAIKQEAVNGSLLTANNLPSY